MTKSLLPYQWPLLFLRKPDILPNTVFWRKQYISYGINFKNMAKTGKLTQNALCMLQKDTMTKTLLFL